eukprot:gene33011-39931_t
MFRRASGLSNLWKGKILGCRLSSSGLSLEDRTLLKRLAAAGDTAGINERLLDLYRLHVPGAKGERHRLSVEKVVANLYSRTHDLCGTFLVPSQVNLAKENALEALTISKCAHDQLDGKTHYVRCVELLEAFLEENQVDLAFQIYQQIEAKNLSLDHRALSKLISKSAELVYVPYIVKVLDKHENVPSSILMTAIEPLVLSGELKKVAQYFDAYLKHVHESNPYHLLHCPWELIQLLQEILKGRVRRALAQPRLPNTEISALESINESLDTYHKHLLDKQMDEQFGEHVEYLLTNIAGYRALPFNFSHADLTMYMEDYAAFFGEDVHGGRMGDGSLYMSLLSYLPENTRLVYPTTNPTPAIIPSNEEDDKSSEDNELEEGEFTYSAPTFTPFLAPVTDITAELRKGGRKRPLLYLSQLFPASSLEAEELLVRGVVGNVFEPYDQVALSIEGLGAEGEDDGNAGDADGDEDVGDLDDEDEDENGAVDITSDDGDGDHPKHVDLFLQLLSGGGLGESQHDGAIHQVGGKDCPPSLDVKDISLSLAHAYPQTPLPQYMKGVFDGMSEGEFVEDALQGKDEEGSKNSDR